MKKHMLLAILIATFFSCTEVLDELNTIDPSVTDSLSNIIIGKDSVVTEDSTAVVDSLITEEDSVVTEEPDNASEELSGFSYTQQEVEIWRDRMVHGPYKTKGDAGINTPGDWERILSNANKFLSDPIQLYYGSMDPEPHTLQIDLKDAAFVYLLTGDTRYGTKVKDFVVKQVQVPEVDFSRWQYFGDVKGFHLADWVVRLLYAYDYSNNLYSKEEKQMINEWFIKAGNFFAANVNEGLKLNFPNRLNEDYSIVSRDAQGGGYTPGEYTYVDQSGQPHHQIYWVHKFYNNRKSSQMKVAGLVGAFLGNQDLIRKAKIYVKELLKYSTFPDGSMGEYERNYKELPSRGLYYSSINIETSMLIADALARRGDFELYDYKTSDGIYGTEGGEKSIHLLMKTYCEIISGVKKWYYNQVNEAYRIKSDYNGTFWANDIWFILGANYYHDQFIIDVITRKNPNVPKYGDKLGSAGPVWFPWGGMGATHPGYLFMYGGLEGKLNPYK